MTLLTTSTVGTRSPSADGQGIGVSVGTGFRSGTILGLLDEVDKPDDGAYHYRRQNATVAGPDERSEGARSVAGSRDVLPANPLLTRVEKSWTTFSSDYGYTVESVADGTPIEELDRMVMVPGLNKLAAEIVNPASSVAFAAEGFSRSLAVYIRTQPDAEPYPWVAEPEVVLSRAVYEIAMNYGENQMATFAAVLHPGFILAQRTKRQASGSNDAHAWPVWPIISQPFGFSLAHGELCGIVGVFSSDTAQLLWKERPNIEHGTIGNQLLKRERTGVMNARYGLAVKTPVAFCRIFAGSNDLPPP